MKLKVPFHKQLGKNDCGPTSLRMVLEYFGEEHEENEIRELAGTAPNGGTWTASIAYASATLGFPTKFYTNSLGMSNMTAAELLAKKENDLGNAKAQIKSIENRAREAGVRIKERFIPIEEILEKTSADCIPIVTLNMSRIIYVAPAVHMVPIVGYDEDVVWYHDSNLPEGNSASGKNIFEEARMDLDGETIFVCRKSIT